MTDSGEIIKKDEEGLELLGIEPWALKSIPKERRIPFLRDAAKLVARYHHPDLYQEDADKKKHGDYLARVNQVVERVTVDRFALEEALSEFNTTQNTRVGLEVKLNKTRENHSKTERAAGNLQNALEELREQYKGAVKENESLASALSQSEMVQASVASRMEELHKQVKFLRSEEGPYKSAERRIGALKAIMKRRATYEALGVQTLPILSDALEGELEISILEKGLVKQNEFDAARASLTPEESIRDLFNAKLGKFPRKTRLKNQQINYDGHPWRVVGSVPFALLRHMERNPIKEFNYHGGGKDKREPMEYEESTLTYVLPFLETADRALTLIKRQYEIEGTQPDIYKLVGITKKETKTREFEPEYII